MKCPKIVILIILTVLSCEYKNTKAVNIANLEIRDGLYFEIEAEHPFTGRAIRFSPDNKLKEAEIEFVRGIPNGQTIVWFNSGQTEYEIEYYEGIPKVLQRWNQNGELIYKTFPDNEIVISREDISRLTKEHRQRYEVYEIYRELLGLNEIENPYYHCVH